MSNKKPEVDVSMNDKLKVFLSIGILLASLYTYYSSPDMHAVLRVLVVIVGFGISGYVFYFSEKGKAWFSYISHAKKEVSLVVWPTRQETVQMTLIVFVVVIIMGIFLWMVDSFFLWAAQLLTGQG